MLTKLEKQILDSLLRGEGGNETPYGIADTNRILAFMPNSSSDAICSACKNLYENGYLTEYSRTLGGNAFVCLSHTGANYSEISRLERWEFIRRSILTPIAVSIITSVITFIVTTVISNSL
jgi:hypothetical protein